MSSRLLLLLLAFSLKLLVLAFDLEVLDWLTPLVMMDLLSLLLTLLLLFVLLTSFPLLTRLLMVLRLLDKELDLERLFARIGSFDGFLPTLERDRVTG